MIEKLKTTLLEIRKDREEELLKYRAICGNDEELYQKRKSILALELPLKTDSTSLMHAYSQAYQELVKEKDLFLDITNTLIHQNTFLSSKEKKLDLSGGKSTGFPIGTITGFSNEKKLNLSGENNINFSNPFPEATITTKITNNEAKNPFTTQ